MKELIVSRVNQSIYHPQTAQEVLRLVRTIIHTTTPTRDGRRTRVEKVFYVLWGYYNNPTRTYQSTAQAVSWIQTMPDDDAGQQAWKIWLSNLG